MSVLQLVPTHPWSCHSLGLLNIFVYDHFKNSGLSGDELTDKVNSRQNWFGIMEGMRSNLAIRWLIKNKPIWKSVT